MVHKGPNFSDFVRFRQHTLRTHSTISDALKDVNNSSLIKLCLAHVKQNTTVKTAIDACSLLAK